MKKEKFMTRLRVNWIVLLLLIGKPAHGDFPTIYGRTLSNAFLDIARDMIDKAKMNIPTCHDSTYRPIDCSDVLSLGHNKSGMYTIWPMTRFTETKPLDVYCDMKTDGGGWTVIQRRGNFGRPENYFYREWYSYKEGFGDKEKDFWIGNDNIFTLTNQRIYSVRFDMQDLKSTKRFALYDTFWIDDEFNNYTLHVSGYSGNAGDSMAFQNSTQFSTKDRDNDNDKDKDYDYNCAQFYESAWWYNDCPPSPLYKIYRSEISQSVVFGLNWLFESAESAEIKIRPKKH